MTANFVPDDPFGDDLGAYRVRFAPSPTGRMHLGNVRSAALNRRLADENGGVMILRVDDTDARRDEEKFVDAIRCDLAWLGIRVDAEIRQSRRRERHSAAFEALKAAGRLYPCYETPEELEAARRRRLALGRPPRYDRAALKLDDEERRALEREGRVPHWRFRLTGKTREWNDEFLGRRRISTSAFSDPVAARSEGEPLYLLAAAADDLDMKISLVTRGDDHVANTAAQIEMIEALGGTPPDFAHHGLVVGDDGAPLSKRDESLSVDALRSSGIEPETIRSLLLASPPREKAAIDLAALRRRNADAMRSLSTETALERIAEISTARRSRPSTRTSPSGRGARCATTPRRFPRRRHGFGFYFFRSRRRSTTPTTPPTPTTRSFVVSRRSRFPPSRGETTHRPIHRPTDRPTHGRDGARRCLRRRLGAERDRSCRFARLSPDAKEVLKSERCFRFSDASGRGVGFSERPLKRTTSPSRERRRLSPAPRRSEGGRRRRKVRIRFPPSTWRSSRR